MRKCEKICLFREFLALEGSRIDVQYAYAKQAYMMGLCTLKPLEYWQGRKEAFDRFSRAVSEYLPVCGCCENLDQTAHNID